MSRHSDNHDHFDFANQVAGKAAMRLLKDSPPVAIADAFIGRGLSIWAADTGEHVAAEKFLELWVSIRDAE